jgi:hypothetical protein
MNDMERRKFEDSFKDAFKDAQMDPTENVWINVELDLEKASGGKMKRRLLFYQLLAAASISFAMCVAGVGYYAYVVKHETTPMANETSSTERFKDQQAQTKQAAPEEEVNTLEAQTEREAGQVDQSTQSQQHREIAPSVAHVDQTDRSHTGNEESPIANNAAKETLANANDGSNKNNAASDAEQQQAIATVGPKDVNGIRERDSNADRKIKNNSSMTDINKQAGTDSNDNQRAAVLAATSARRDEQLLTTQNRPLVPLVVLEKAKVMTPKKEETTADPFALMMAIRRDEERALNEKAKKDKKQRSDEKLWTSVGLAAGSFSTVNRSISSSINPDVVPAANNQTKAAGVSYTVGVSVGTKISGRWVVQGGVNYLNQISAYTSDILVNISTSSSATGRSNTYTALNANNVAEITGSSSAYTNADPNAQNDDVSIAYAKTTPYGVNNTMEFVSIPVQAGYLIVDKKIGVQLNAGVSTDLFIKNTESANVNNGSGKSVNRQERGSSDSPFRDVNFTGLIGTEVSYRVGDRYRVSVIPGVRYPFNSMYKSASQIQATPLTFDVGLKFRYIFE